MGEVILKLNNVDKKFEEQVVFENFNMEVEKGVIELFGEKNIKPFSKKANIMLREKTGYLFQNFALINNETVYYNKGI